MKYEPLRGRHDWAAAPWLGLLFARLAPGKVRLSTGKIVASIFCCALVTVYLQHALLHAHLVASAARPLSMLRRSQTSHPAMCPLFDEPTDEAAPEAATAAEGSAEPEDRSAISWLLRRQRIFSALEGTRSQLDELAWTAQALPLEQQRDPLPETAPLTAIALHDEPSTVCRQSRALLMQRPPPAQLWLVTFTQSTRVRQNERAAQLAEQAAVAARAEARRAPASVSAVRLPAALRPYAHMQLALQATTEYVMILEPRAIPSQWFVQTALTLAAHARATGDMPPLLGEAGCVVLPAAELHDVGVEAQHRAGGGGAGSAEAALRARGVGVGRGSGGALAGRFGHVCAPHARSGLLLERPVSVDYLDGFAFMHASWPKLVLSAEPDDGESSAASVFLALSDVLRRVLGVRTLLLPASTDAPGAASPTPQFGLKWPVHVLGEPAPDASLVRALRAGMQPVALRRDGRMRAGAAAAAAQAHARGAPGGAHAAVRADEAPAERWLLVAQDFASARALGRALGPLCAAAGGAGEGPPGGAGVAPGAAPGGAPPHRRALIRCDVLVADEGMGGDPSHARGMGPGAALRDLSGMGDLRWGRAFSSEVGWSATVERRDERTRARRLTRTLVYLRDAVRPHLVFAAVGGRAQTHGAAGHGAAADHSAPTALDIALRAAFGGDARDSSDAARTSPAFAHIAAWDLAGSAAHGAGDLAALGAGGAGAGGAGDGPRGADGGAALGGAALGGGFRAGTGGAGGADADGGRAADAERAEGASARLRIRLPIALPAHQLPSAEWIGTLPPRALAQWHVPRITIVVITWRRPQSLKRLCAALAAADYYGDTVGLKFAMDAGADVETRRFVASFRWPHGPKSATVRAVHAGLAVAVVESWQPSSDDEYAVLLEDDIEVAPSFYGWLKYALLMYRHGDESARDPRMIGISLYTPRLVEVARPRRRIDLFSELGGRPFLQQLPCSWGALFFPEPWRAFRDYLLHRTSQDPSVQVHIPGSVVNGWKGSWKKYLIELMYRRAQWMLYPNFRNQTSFSTNHLEQGEHIGAKGQLSHLPEDFTVPLLGRDFVHQLPGRSLERRAAQLIRLDLFSNRTTDDLAVYKGLELLAKRTSDEEG